MVEEAMPRSRGKYVLAGIIAVISVGCAIWLLAGNGQDSGPEAGPKDWATRYEIEGVSDPADFASITGTVKSSKGDGVAGARVCLRTTRATSTTLSAFPTCVRSGRDGGFSFQEVVPGVYSLLGSAEGMLPAMFPERPGRLSLPPGAREDGIVLTLRPGGVAVSGTVEDFFGGAVEGAVVSAGGTIHVLGATTASDDNGAFRLWTSPDQQVLAISAQGYARTERDVFAPAEDVRIRLLPEGVVEGTVVEDESGTPVPGARVRIKSADGDAGAGSNAITLTDAKGHFRLDGLLPGGYQLIARKPGAYGKVAGGLQLSLAEHLGPLTIRIAPIPTVEGRVLLADSEEPCQRGFVTLTDPGANINWRSTIRKDGTVQLPVPAAGHYDVSVECIGSVARPRYPRLSVLDGTSPPAQTWYVDPGATISGRVLSSTGDAIAGAEVRAEEHPLVTAAGGLGSTKTDDEGRYQLSGLRADHEHLVRAYAPGTAPLETPVVVVPPATKVDVELPASGSIEGRVRATTATASELLPELSVRVDGQHRALVAEGTGAFEIDGVLPGFREVSIVDRHGSRVRDASGAAARVTVEVTSGAPVEVNFSITPPTSSIRGKVLGSDGEPVPDALVSAFPSTGPDAKRPSGPRDTGGWRNSAATDDQGGFVIEGLQQAERYSLQATSRDGDAFEDGVVPGDAPVSLVIDTTGGLRGVVQMPDGHPNSFWVTLESPDVGVSKTDLFRVADGRFAFSGLPPGPYEVSVRASEGFAHAQVRVESNADTEVSISLEEYCAIDGRVVGGETGEPVGGVRVVARQLSGTIQTQHKPPGLENYSTPTGRFHLGQVPCGRVSVHAMPRAAGMPHPTHHPVTLVVELGAGATADVGDLELPMRQRLDGQERGDYGFTLSSGDDPTSAPTVATLEPAGAAAEAGLRVGDTVVKLNGRELLREGGSLASALLDVRPGAVLTVTVDDGRQIKLTAR